MKNNGEIRVGLTERHGTADEASLNPPQGVKYSFPQPTSKAIWPLASGIEGFLSKFNDSQVCDLYEAVLCPIRTDSPWICSLGSIHSALAFNLMNVPIPRRIRLRMVERLFLKDNFHKLIFRSQAAMAEFLSAVPYVRHSLIDKSTVVYPAIRCPDNRLLDESVRNCINLLFTGEFFRKGGASVVDAFLRLQSRHENLRLRLCCDPSLDFKTPNGTLRNKYLRKVSENSSISLGRVSREELMHRVLPETDLFLMPTYSETFGFAILEAMAHGIPVVSSRHFAIPEMVEHERSGFLVDYAPYDVSKLFPGYVVTSIPEAFHASVTDQVEHFVEMLIQSRHLRSEFGSRAREIAMTKFSFERRNALMLRIYLDAVA